MLPLQHCQKRLLLLWLIGSIPAVLLMISRSIIGSSYSGREDAVWAWFTPSIMPTLALIIGSYAATAVLTKKKAPKNHLADPLFFYVAMGVSGFYLFLVNTIVIIQPFLDAPALVTMQRAGLFLGVVQGFGTACLGVFFVTGK